MWASIAIYETLYVDNCDHKQESYSTITMSGRLPGLNQGKPPAGSALKFKPKVVARRSKEERDASAPKIEEVKKPTERKKYAQRPKKPNNERRQQRFLDNTRVITSGPLAAGNFSVGPSKPTGFIKTDGSQSKLVEQGLKGAGSDEDGDELSDSEGVQGGKRINMGKEFTAEDFKKETDDLFEDDANDLTMDEESLRSKQIASLLPIRAIRITHSKVDSMKKAVQESMTDPNTRDPTPGPVKLEHEGSSNVLADVVSQRKSLLEDKLKSLELKNDHPTVDHEDALREANLLFEDHKHLQKKLTKLNDVPNKFMFFQFPTDLPEFEKPLPKTSSVPKTEADEIESGTTKETRTQEDTDMAKGRKKVVPEEKVPLIGNIGSIRVHKSGKLTVKIGNVVMDISRGAESTFLQDVVALDTEGEEVELLGQVDGRAVITPAI